MKRYVLLLAIILCGCNSQPPAATPDPNANDLQLRTVEALERQAAAAEQQAVATRQAATDEMNRHAFDSLNGWNDQ